MASVGDVVSDAQYGMNAPSEHDGETPIVGMKDIREGRVLFDNLARITVSDSELEAYRLRGGDLLINRTNSLDQVGKVGIVNADNEIVFASYLVRLVADRSKIEPEFLNLWLNGSSAQRTFKRIATPAIGQANLNPTELQKYCLLPLPPLGEQRRISELLQTWGRAIEQTDRLIKLKEAQCSYLRATLVSWIRWPRCPIGKVITSVSRPEPTPTHAYKALSLRSHGKGTFQRIVERPEEIDMDKVYVVGARDLIVNITFAWEGAIALARPEDAGCFVSHRFPTFEIEEKKINREYLGYAIRSRQFVHRLGIASPGGAGRNRVLNKRDLLKIEIPLPPKAEQDRIAAILRTADFEVSLLIVERAAFDRQRRGLVQKLLEGVWRVPLNGAVAASAAEGAIK
jgi:type I restriction enzyme S subunit